MSARDVIPPGGSIDPIALIRSRDRAQPAVGRTQLSVWWRLMEGAISALIVLIVSFPVMNSIARARWVDDMPDLRLVGFVALVSAALFSASRLHWTLAVLLSLPIGAVVVFWQVLTVDAVAGQSFFFDRFEDLWFRLDDWFTQAFNAGITTDNLPFVLFVTGAAWLLVFFGSFAVLRGRHPWLLIITLGTMLAINVSYLDGKQWDTDFAFFAAGAAMLVMRTNLLTRMEGWRSEGARFPDFISFSFLVATLIFIIGIMVLSRAVPRPDQSETLNDFWDDATSPFGDLSDEFSRLFSGIDSQSGAPIHNFSDVFVLQGDINPGDQIVVRVDSPEPGLLRGVSYDRYTTRGWQLSDTTATPVGEGEAIAVIDSDDLSAPAYLERRTVTTRVSVESSPAALFSFGSPTEIDREVSVETTASAIEQLDLSTPDSITAPELRGAVEGIVELSSERTLTEAEALRFIPDEFEVIAISGSVEDVGITSITVESRPDQPDVVAIRPADRVRAGFTYQVSGTVSSASSEALRAAGQDYPLWVRDRFTQLPADLANADFVRLQNFAQGITTELGATTPYDAAAAIEAFLATMPLLDLDGNPVLNDGGEVRLLYPFETSIAPVPIGADAVTWFLFENLGDDGFPIGGYYDYHASAMAVLLRSLGIPARISTGFVLTEDNFDVRTRTYIVRGRHAFSWVEVYFPQYGWVDFDPTPLETPTDFDGIAGTRAAAQRFRPFTSDVFSIDEEDDLLEFGSLELLLQGAELDDLTDIDLGTSRDDNGIGGWSILGPVLGLAVLSLIGGSGAVVWFWPLRSLGPAERSWKATQRLAGWVGHPVNPTQTPTEFADVLGRVICAEDGTNTLAEHYTRVRFGRKRLNDADTAEIKQAWRVVRGRLVRRLLRLPVPAPVDSDEGIALAGQSQPSRVDAPPDV